MDTLIKVAADGLVILVVILSGLTFLLSIKSDKYQQYARAIMAGLTSLTIAKVMSLLYHSGDRPFIALGVDPKASYLNNPGFPSDHALFVFTLTFIVFAATKNINVSLIIFILSILVSFGRVAALVHSPIDVFGGFIAALLGVWLWYGGNWRKNY